MKMTPLDIRQKRFDIAFRGFNRGEVEAFLELTASHFEEVVRETITLRDEIKHVMATLESHLGREKALQETMVTAQRVSDEVRSQARKEASLKLAEAELQAEKIVASANQRLIELATELNELKRQKVQFESHLESLIDSHKQLLLSWKTRGADITYLVKKAPTND